MYRHRRAIAQTPRQSALRDLGYAGAILVWSIVAFATLVADAHGQYGLTNVGVFTVGTAGEPLAMTAIGVALAPLALLLARGCAKAHAALAVRLLGPHGATPRHAAWMTRPRCRTGSNPLNLLSTTAR